MSAYLIYLCHDVTDRSDLEKYWEVTQPTFRGQQVRIHTAYTPLQVVEGAATVHGVVIAEYPSFEACRIWYDSPGYVSGRQHRLRGSEYLGLLAEGTVGAAPGAADGVAGLHLPATRGAEPVAGVYLLQLLDETAEADHLAAIEGSLTAAGGTVLSVTTRIDVLEGDRPVSTVVLARFASTEPARAWHAGRPGGLTLLIDGGWLPPDERMPHLTARSAPSLGRN